MSTGYDLDHVTMTGDVISTPWTTLNSEDWVDFWN